MWCGSSTPQRHHCERHEKDPQPCPIPPAIPTPVDLVQFPQPRLFLSKNLQPIPIPVEPRLFLFLWLIFPASDSMSDRVSRFPLRWARRGEGRRAKAARSGGCAGTQKQSKHAVLGNERVESISTRLSLAETQHVQKPIRNGHAGCICRLKTIIS